MKRRHNHSYLDYAYYNLGRALGRAKFFSGGLGDKNFLDTIDYRLTNLGGFSQAPVILKKIGHHYEGRFLSPYSSVLPNESKWAYFKFFPPKNLNKLSPIVIQTAATGDEGHENRLKGFKPLIKKGMGTLILEIPFYGLRRPAGQHAAFLKTYSDFWKMCLASIEEGILLSRWLYSQGYRHIGITGVSMGGNVVSLMSPQLDFPHALIPCIPSHSPAPVFLQGHLSGSVDWERLEADMRGARGYLRETMEICDIRRWNAPDSKYTQLILAKHDGYIPKESSQIIIDHWAGVPNQWLETGHVGTVTLKARSYIAAIENVMNLLREL